MKHYPEYKASGVPWLGDVPTHWLLLRGKWLFKAAKVINTERKHSNVLSLTLRGVVNNDIDNPEGLVPKDYATYQYFAEGDLVFKLIDLENLRTSRVGLVHQDGIMSPAYIRLTPVHNGAQRYYFHQYYDLYQRGIYNQLGAGVRSTLTAEDLLDVPVLLPPLDEQQAIVRYLDHIDRRVRRYIRAKQRLLALLHEQKQAIIHQAVTRGLDASAPLKPSGSEVIGNIPDDFLRTKLTRVCTSIRDGTHNPPLPTPGVHRLLSVRNIINGRFVTRNDDRTMSPAAFEGLQQSYSVKEGDVVLALVGATTGKSAVVGKMENVTVQRSIGILRPKPDVIDSHFLNLVISSQIVQSQIQGIMNKYAAQPGIYLADVGNLQVVFPDIQQQREIVTRVDEQTHVIDAVILRSQHEIDLIREYRTRLIADVVTGKVDVRAAAGALPAEVGEEEAWAASEVEEDGEEGSEEELQRMQTENG